ncbi:MAG: hypothetical protein MUE94_05285 [Verrucomicrobia bacterium]|jgi:hypothetical protein|nr:hypothetical protein [Verrucomicrobiota bacterium]
MKPQLLAAGIASVLLCSCASTRLKETWKAPGAQPAAGRVAVLAIDERGLVRQGFENRFVAQLVGSGAPAVVTYEQLSLAEIKEDKKAAAERFRSSGAGTLLIVRLVGTGTSYREVRAGPERYATTVTGFESVGWYDYYSVGFMDMQTSYGSSKRKVCLEASLYDLATEKRLWAGLTQTVVDDRTDRVAEIEPLAAQIVASMREDGILP